MVKKAITHLKLEWGNASKLHRLDELAAEHQRVVQAYVSWLIAHGARQPDKYAGLPAAEIPTPLSDRWQRCAWQQACGIVQSWYSNGRVNPPVLRNVCLQANSNVVVIEPSKTQQFDYWLRVSTLKKGQPVRLPIRLYEHAKETLAQFPKLCSGVTLNRRDGVWYATFVVERRGAKLPSTQVVGVDIGMVSMVSTSEGKRYGQVSLELRRRVECTNTRRRRKQKLNACLRRKGKPAVSLGDHRAEAFARNEIGQALNRMLRELPEGAGVALERLNVKDMRLKSRQMNRALRASQLGYLCDKLKFKLDERSIRYRAVQAAYSSQQCSQCGFTFPMNRRSQAEFHCLWCGFEANADVNAAQVIAERFGDAELNTHPFCEVETVLATRFMRRMYSIRRLPGAPRCTSSPAPARLELNILGDVPKGKEVVALGSPPTVNQPGQYLYWNKCP
jgi:Putative transposase DNA-binding domain